MKYERGRLDEFPKAFKEFRDWQAEQDILSDGVYGNESHNTMWDYLRFLKDALESADAKIMELSIRLDECCVGGDPGPSQPEGGVSVGAVVLFVILAAALGFLGGQVF